MIAEPDIHWCDIDDACEFMLLMSDGLYSSLETATGSAQVNVDIANMVATEFRLQATLNGVAQAVVDRVVRIHHDAFMMASDQSHKEACQRRDDITLLVRQFNARAQGRPLLQHNVSQNMGTNDLQLSPLSVVLTEEAQQPTGLSPKLQIAQNYPPKTMYPSSMFSPYDNIINTISSTISSTLDMPMMTNTTTQRSTDSAESTGEECGIAKGTPLPLDTNGQIAPYVDFSDFYNATKDLTEAELNNMENEFELRPDIETIPEESDQSLENWTQMDASINV